MRYSQMNRQQTKGKAKHHWLNRYALYFVYAGLFIAGLIVGVSIITFAKAQDVTSVSTSGIKEADRLIINNDTYQNEEDAQILAKLIWGEARGVQTTDEKAAVAWCVLNRVDSEQYPDTIREVVTQDSQFCGYDEDYPVTIEMLNLAEDVLTRWEAEKKGVIESGRILPKDYLFFIGDGEKNYFSSEWQTNEWYDWSLPSPYNQ